MKVGGVGSNPGFARLFFLLTFRACVGILYIGIYSMQDEKVLFERLDKIISLLEIAGKQPSLFIRILNGLATGAGILGILSVVDLIKTWLGG